MGRLVTLDFSDWSPHLANGAAQDLARELEGGKVLYLPQLHFALNRDELSMIDARWADRKAKNISFDGARNALAGVASDDPTAHATLREMLARYRRSATGLIHELFPRYREHLRVARTSLRLIRVENRSSSWRKDDTRLHVDAFPSRPNHGERILRVFHNANPHGEPRVWRVGDTFESVAQRFLPAIAAQWPGSARLMQWLRITKSRRSAYDHLMLQLHDHMKADGDYQANGAQELAPMAAGSTWICYSDQTPHAVMSGQFMFEQTLHLPIEALYTPEQSPLRVLERLKHAALV